MGSGLSDGEGELEVSGLTLGALVGSGLGVDPSSGATVGAIESEGLGEGDAEMDSVGSGSSATAGALVNVPSTSGKDKKDKKTFLGTRCFTTTANHTFYFLDKVEAKPLHLLNFQEPQALLTVSDKSSWLRQLRISLARDTSATRAAGSPSRRST